MRIASAALVAAAALIVGADAYSKQELDAYMATRVLNVFKWNQTAVVEVLAAQCASRITCVDAIRPGFSYRLASGLNMQAPIILLTKFASGSPLTINDAIPGFAVGSGNPLAYTPQVLNPSCGPCLQGTETACAEKTPSIIKSNLQALMTQNFTSWNPVRTDATCMEFVTLWAIANEAVAKAYVDANKVQSCAIGKSSKTAGTFEDIDCTTLFLAGDDVLSYLGPVEAYAGQIYRNSTVQDLAGASAAAAKMYTAFNLYNSIAAPLTLQTAVNFTKNLGAFYAVNARLDKTFERIANVFTSNQSHLIAAVPKICPNIFCADYYRPNEDWVYNMLASAIIVPGMQATMLDLTLFFAYAQASPASLADGTGNNLNTCLQSCSLDVAGSPTPGCLTTVNNIVTPTDGTFNSLSCFDWVRRWRLSVVPYGPYGAAGAKIALNDVIAATAAAQCNDQTAQLIQESLSNMDCGKLLVDLANITAVTSIIDYVYGLTNNPGEAKALENLQGTGLNAAIMLPTIKSIVAKIQSNAYATGVVLADQATSSPTKLPTKSPTKNPTKAPTKNPTKPTASPSKAPTNNPGTPTTKAPTTKAPTTKAPTLKPSGALATSAVVLTQFAIVAMTVVGLFVQ